MKHRTFLAIICAAALAHAQFSGMQRVGSTSGATPGAHAASHTDGTDDIQSATNAQKGVATAAQITTLEGLDADAILKTIFTVDSGILVGTGAGTYAEETGATVRTSLGLGTADTVQFGTLQAASGTTVNEFSIDGTLAGDSDDAVPTEKAVKAYVDASGGGGTTQGDDATYDIHPAAQLLTPTTGGGEYSVDLMTNRTTVNQAAAAQDSGMFAGSANSIGATNTGSVIIGSTSTLCRGTGSYMGVFSADNGEIDDGDRSVILGGEDNLINPADYSGILAGRDNHCGSGSYSAILAGRYGKTTRRGEVVNAMGRFAEDGDAQYSRMVLKVQTTDATANVELFADSSFRYTLGSDEAVGFTVKITGVQVAGAGGAEGNMWAYMYRGACRNVGGTTALIGTVQSLHTPIESDAGADAQVTADDTNDSVKIDVTGVANCTINWTTVIECENLKW